MIDPRTRRGRVVIAAAAVLALGIGDCDTGGTAAPPPPPSIPADPPESPSAAATETVEFDTDAGSGTYTGPLAAPSGGTLEGRICIGGMSGVPWFVTLGEPPSAPEATHHQGTLGDDGCMPFTVDVGWPVGTGTVLYTSDGEAVWAVTDIDVEDAAG